MKKGFVHNLDRPPVDQFSDMSNKIIQMMVKNFIRMTDNHELNPYEWPLPSAYNRYSCSSGSDLKAFLAILQNEKGG
jgi:hypothetical protein